MQGVDYKMRKDEAAKSKKEAEEAAKTPNGNSAQPPVGKPADASSEKETRKAGGGPFRAFLRVLGAFGKVIPVLGRISAYLGSPVGQFLMNYHDTVQVGHPAETTLLPASIIPLTLPDATSYKLVSEPKES